eukprot:gnl/MRDRNA2_/MRDRNA2_57939_c0_seq1.p1 gnl/MRDRNA2_/MRDRNA2_57939_c0~~gnl/MRDRNA2_/MRDRNA2_57939_c0_seq1.p1  ORF type:complete len:425 (-),score=100.29 gnl/MRDRNA2_/MRDRNA2_57939_c0_seq1:568-1842(-)
MHRCRNLHVAQAALLIQMYSTYASSSVLQKQQIQELEQESERHTKEGKEALKVQQGLEAKAFVTDLFGGRKQSPAEALREENAANIDFRKASEEKKKTQQLEAELHKEKVKVADRKAKEASIQHYEGKAEPDLNPWESQETAAPKSRNAKEASTQHDEGKADAELNPWQSHETPAPKTRFPASPGNSIFTVHNWTHSGFQHYGPTYPENVQSTQFTRSIFLLGAVVTWVIMIGNVCRCIWRAIQNPAVESDSACLKESLLVEEQEQMSHNKWFPPATQIPVPDEFGSQSRTGPHNLSDKKSNEDPLMTSRLGVFTSTAQQSARIVTVSFSVSYKAHLEELGVVGNVAGLGKWNPADAALMQWNPVLNKWETTVEMEHPFDEPIEYKYVVIANGQAIKWEHCENRVLSLSRYASSGVCDDIWGRK